MSFQHKSGALKRKEKRVREERERCGQQTLFSSRFLKNTVDTRSATTSTVSVNENTSSSNSENVSDHHQSDAESVEEEYKEEQVAEATSSSQTTLTHTTMTDSDIGCINSMICSQAEIEQLVRSGPPKHPADFPKYIANRSFPTSLLQSKLPNNETVSRDWLVWSSKKQALFCFPCRLFSTQAASMRSFLASPSGYTVYMQWRKLYEKIPEHQKSNAHKECYLKWRNYEKDLRCNAAVFHSLQKQLDSEVEVWKQILRRLLDVTLFLGERGLAFRGETQKIGQSNNGNFLGILELLSHYDPLLEKHLSKVKELQQSGHRMQVHYLSSDIKNEFIACCAHHVRNVILKEREAAKYYSRL
jgi:hypothetical protein